MQLSRLGGAALLLLGSAILCGNARVDRIPSPLRTHYHLLSSVQAQRRVIDSATVIVIAPNSRRGRFFQSHPDSHDENCGDRQISPCSFFTKNVTVLENRQLLENVTSSYDHQLDDQLLKELKFHQIFMWIRFSARSRFKLRPSFQQLLLLITFLITNVVLTRNANTTKPREYLLDPMSDLPCDFLKRKYLCICSPQRRCWLSHRASQR